MPKVTVHLVDKAYPAITYRKVWGAHVEPDGGLVLTNEAGRIIARFAAGSWLFETTPRRKYLAGGG